MTPIVPIENLKREISSLSDQCVKCGLCSAKCPTYKLHADENESPRGRIALAQAISADAVQSFDRAKHHLDNCLYCQLCETSCPSGVKYTQIIDKTLEVVNRTTRTSKQSRLEAFGIKFLSRQKEERWSKIALIWKLLFPITGKLLLKKFKIDPRAVKRTTANKTNLAKSTIANKRKVILFSGCTSHLFDQQTFEDSISLLEYYGYEVDVPKKQTCCGAIAKHRGYSELYRECENNNTVLFDKTDSIPIIYTATGCGATLHQYSSEISQRFIDINQFISSNIKIDSADLQLLTKKVIIHSPCSQQKSITSNNVVETVIRNIPAIDVLDLKYGSCCGAGGSHFMRNPNTAAQLRTPLVTQLKESKPDYVVSSNYTCAMHITSGLLEKGVDIQVIHPISLLVKQLKNKAG